MSRRPNTRPTLIYWLIDIRPETIAAGWPVGKPFYCGKTIELPRKRLDGHRAKAKIWPMRATHKRVIECGQFIELRIMETVAPGADWVEREKHWIESLRFSFPDTTNVSAGVVGTPGQIPSAETRAKRSAAMRGRRASDETKAKMRAAWKNRLPESPETRAKKSASAKLRKATTESRARMSAAQKGRTVSAEHRAKISQTLKGRKLTPEQYANYIAAMADGTVRAKIGAKQRGKVASEETRRKLSEAHRGRKHSPETKAKIAATNKAIAARHQQEAAQHA